MNIILIGMPGCGKSTVGVVLAKVTGMKFCDADLVIQQRTKKKLQDIINEEGLDAFLRNEEEALLSLCEDNTVIATGGSAIYSARAMAHLKKNGKAVYLHVSERCMEKRLKNFSRRGVAIADGMTLADLYNERTPLYEAFADVTVSAERMDVSAIVRRITRALDTDEGESTP